MNRLCKYNDNSVFSPKKYKLYMKLIRARKDLSAAKEKIDQFEDTRNGDPYQLNLNLQIANQRVRDLFNQIKPELMKG